MIKVRYFANLREELGRAEDELTPDEAGTAAEVWARANPDHPLPERVLVAVNMEYVPPDEAVKDGDEVAFFPPVTGG